MRSECAAHSDSEAQVTVRCTGEMLLILPTENRELEMGCWRQNVIRSCRTSRLSESILPNMLPGAQIREERACGEQGERTPECGGESATWQAGRVAMENDHMTSKLAKQPNTEARSKL